MTPEEKNQSAGQPNQDAPENAAFQQAIHEAGSNQSGVGSITDALEAGAADISQDSKGKKEGDAPAGEAAQTTSGV
ncbi:MAG: hypothetical protein ICV83_24885 [Cytophagales bacterium]|nr:hypothetical protein [Cytophagales bacterium]